MIDEDDFWSNWWNEIWQGKPKYSRKPTPAPLCPPQNPTWQTRSRTPDRSGGKPATNRLSYGAAFFSLISSPLMTRRFAVEAFDPASTRVYVTVTVRTLEDKNIPSILQEMRCWNIFFKTFPSLFSSFFIPEFSEFFIMAGRVRISERSFRGLDIFFA
jgi:hypothetical protein